MKTHNWCAVYDMACFGFVLAQVRPLSDSWQDIRLTAGLVPAALLLSLFNSLHSSILLEDLMADGLLPHFKQATFCPYVTRAQTVNRDVCLHTDCRLVTPN